MIHFSEIYAAPSIMGGKPCIRGTRVTVGCVVEQLGAGASRERLLELYPYMTAERIDACLRFAAWRASEEELSLKLSA